MAHAPHLAPARLPPDYLPPARMHLPEASLSNATTPQPGKPIPSSLLLDVPRLVAAYYTGRPDSALATQRVAFGTSGHRGSAFTDSFNEAHILAITQAICQHRAAQGLTGPLFIGIDTHALSTPALITALEVLIANGVETMVDEGWLAGQGGHTPTPVISHAILAYNRGRISALADGIVITPSHNPPEDGGFKYNGPNGGPADTDVTAAIERTANLLLATPAAIHRIPYAAARRAPNLHPHDHITPYVADLANVIDLPAIAAAGLRIGIDPLGGAALAYWPRIAEHHHLAITVVNTELDPTFRFMPADWDGRLRMDCSSPHAMAGLITLGKSFDIAFANDPDADRHGIVTPSAGLMNPNHYLAVAIDYLWRHRPAWPAARAPARAIGKTIVSSALIDRVAASLAAPLVEVPVGFKWFVEGLAAGTLGFGGEESAGASFLRQDGTVWSTDKDGLILGLLAAEITARTGHDPAAAYRRIAGTLGAPCYRRIDAPATPERKRRLKALTPAELSITELAGETVSTILTTAPGNGAPIGGLKVVAPNGWFAVRPSGTEDVYKLYAESFVGEAHLQTILQQAQEAVDNIK